LPDEVRAAADYLGLTLQQFFVRYLVVDWWKEDAVEIPLLSPGKPDEHGQIASVEFTHTFAECIFLKEGRCSIHPVKPHECKAAHHSRMGKRVGNVNHHHQVARAWMGEEGCALLREVGYDPDLFEVPLPQFEDVLAKLLGIDLKGV